jgi:hypothetical protein
VDLNVEAGYSTGFGNDHLKFAGIKLGHDGSMSAGNCAVYESYLNYPPEDNIGVIHGYTNEQLVDFAVLDTDILTCNPGDIHKTKVATTIVDGKVVYKREG